jgi:uncharacterized protein YegJ (DUF2314 family)
VTWGRIHSAAIFSPPVNAPARLHDKVGDHGSGGASGGVQPRIVKLAEIATMAFSLTPPLKWAVLVAVTGISVCGILAIGPMPELAVQDRSQDRSPVDIRTDDAEMNDAIGRARSTLPTFWASYDTPKPSEAGHSLKVRFFATGRDGEHVWMGDVKRLSDDRYSGRFANMPRRLPGRKEGDRVEFREADISDWMFMRNGKIVGGETIKPMLKSMSKADADALRARMEQP